jgi:RNA-directed DNA polymerase
MENDQKNIGAGGQTELIKRRRSEVPDAERVKTLQDKLYQKAKQEKSYKFYILYDKIFQSYMLREAWQQVRMNQGSAGVDGITISDIEANDIDTYLQELSEELRKRTYKPQAVKRVMIPKANGGERPLGIPTVKDRIVQTVCKMIIEPIFEADFEDSSYGFRPQRSSKDAMKAIKEHLKSGKTEVLDADLSKFFDSIPHEKLMLTLKERIADPRILQLIHSWLKAPVKEKNGMSGGKKNKTGTPQGGVISPLLANVYLHLLDRIINSTRSEFNKLGICIVRYADDFVLMAKSIPETVIDKLRTLLERMGLSLNAEKTKRINAQESTFNFLGFTVRYSNDLYVANKKYWEIMPSKQSEIKVKTKISDYLSTHGHLSGSEIGKGLNLILSGWLNYFEIKGVSYTKQSRGRLRHYLSDKLYRYYRRKSQRRSKLYEHDAFTQLVNKFNLIDPSKFFC